MAGASRRPGVDHEGLHDTDLGDGERQHLGQEVRGGVVPDGDRLGAEQRGPGEGADLAVDLERDAGSNLKLVSGRRDAGAPSEPSAHR